ncbi:MAG: DNA-directed RNA polymerase subunit omega [Bacteroidia bacterium]|nr:DNA-directed RNA polymerase subunit omega [Bacteroidia bacterium]NNM15263.1 DNA-directed RNA polymerase subunit omega [Bacteroidia bacterium]
MKYKASTTTTVTRNQKDFNASTENIYESLAIISKRANQISSEMKEELNNKLAEFGTASDNLEEIFENREQIEISKFYERLPKPTIIGIEEFLNGDIYHRNPSVDANKAIQQDNSI